MRRGARAAVALLALAGSCGGVTTVSPASPSPYTEPSPPFNEILLVSKFVEYKVHYRFTATGQSDGLSGEQTWYLKLGKARFDVKTTVDGKSTTVSLFSLLDGTFMCSGVRAQTTCVAVPGIDSFQQQNPAAFYQESLIAHPDRFSGVVVEQFHIAGSHAHCYDVHPLASSSDAVQGQFCYSLQGIPLRSRFSAQSREWSIEATSLSVVVPDADLTLPAKPTVVGQP